MKRINIGILLFTASVAALATGCRDKDLEAFNTLEKDRFLVKTERAQIRDIEEYLPLVGSVKAMDEAVLYSRVSGKLLKNLLIEGDRVEKDQPVALVERDEPGVLYEPAPVPSTLDGVIGRMYQDSGTNVTPQTPIALVVNQGNVRIIIDVPERYIGKVHRGQNAHIKVDAFPDSVFHGKVYRISPVVDSRTRSTAIEILAGNSDGRLKSGMFSEVRLVVGSKRNATAVPSAAVLDDDGRSYVFVPINDTAVRREVGTGITNGDLTQISRGLKAGDELITFGLYGLKDGSKIKITE